MAALGTDSWGEGGTIPVGFTLTRGVPVLSTAGGRLIGCPRKLGSGRTEGERERRKARGEEWREEGRERGSKREML